QLVEAELMKERDKREETEVLLADIRKECKSPFVVPALLDAFLSISKLANKAGKPI
ncbi:hypothetical protein C8J56DRAFT_774125, partial [Mycena floridula]